MVLMVILNCLDLNGHERGKFPPLTIDKGCVIQAEIGAKVFLINIIWLNVNIFQVFEAVYAYKSIAANHMCISQAFVVQVNFRQAWFKSNFVFL